MSEETTILAVDDSPESLALLVRLLTPAGYKVLPADSGELALAAVAMGPPDLILLDVRMPGMDGLEVCRQLKAGEETRNTPVILISAFAETKDWVSGLQAGAVDYITKPFHPQELLARVRTHLSLRRASLALDRQAAVFRQANVKLQAEIAVRQRVEEELRRGLELADRGRLALLGALEDHRKAEKALETSNIRYRRLFEAAKDGVLLLDAESGAIVDVNPYLTELTGFPREEFLGKHLWEIGPFRDTAASEALFVELQDREYVRYDDLPLETRNGRVIDVEFVSSAYGVGEQKVIQCSIRDISDRKRAEEERATLEEQLRMSQKMEAVGKLAGGIAHDFNNLLSVILSYTGFALEAVKQGDPLREDLLEVKKSGERAAALTRQLLAFSRKQVLQPEPLSLNQIAGGVEKMLRRILGEDIELIQVLAPDLGLTLADPGQMEQVLMNLVVNARDAMPDGGTLTIETANAELDGEYAARHVAVKPGPYVQLVVSDTGCGMDSQTQTQIFEPFFTTKEKGKGTGLGLSMVYGIVKQTGGNIWVYSEPGRGTTFKVYLPRDLSGAVAAASRPVVVPLRATGTETILVVEDEESLRRVARRALAAGGYKVLTAAEGREALRIAAEHPGEIQLLLTDVVMPGMDGRTLAQALSKVRPNAKVLYMSGYTDDAVVHHGVLDAGTHFLSKPFTAVDLTRKVREALDGSGPERGAVLVPGTEVDAEPQPKLLDGEALRVLPPEVVEQMGRAAIAARYDEMIALIETIGTTEPRVAAELRRMVDRFDYDGLRALLRS